MKRTTIWGKIRLTGWSSNSNWVLRPFHKNGPVVIWTDRVGSKKETVERNIPWMKMVNFVDLEHGEEKMFGINHQVPKYNFENIFSWSEMKKLYVMKFPSRLNETHLGPIETIFSSLVTPGKSQRNGLQRQDWKWYNPKDNSHILFSASFTMFTSHLIVLLPHNCPRCQMLRNIDLLFEYLR